MDMKRIAALQCAVRVLDGSAGGYTAADKYSAKCELMDAILEEEGKKERSVGSGK